MTEALALGFGAALAIVCVLFVARPFLRDPGTEAEDLRKPGPVELERLRREEERDRALAALKELEFDHRTGKISDADYRVLVAQLRRQAAEALRALDPGTGLPRERATIHARDGKERMQMPTESPLGPGRVPEPWPPPDEGDLPGPPTPSPGEPTPGPEEPAPPEHPPMPETTRRPA